jgi:hypothetical protein
LHKNKGVAEGDAMTRSKSHEPVRLREKDFASTDEITQAMEKLQARIKQVEELKKEGLAYRDALRTTAEFQIRDTIREIFGEKSPEYHEHQHHKIKANSKHELNATITMLQDLITSLEHKLRPPDPASEAKAPVAPTNGPPAAPPSYDAQPVRVQTASAQPPRPAAQPRPTSASPSAHGRKPSHGEPSDAPANTASTQKEPSPGRAEKTEAVQRIRKVCSRFHPVVRQLRQRSEDRTAFEVEDETDVRDLFRALLSMEFEDITVEEWLPSYAGGSARSVILLRPEGIVLDVKKTRQGLGTKELAEQAMVDFQQFPGLDCRVVFCFVYDPEGRIPNPRRLESDLTGQLHGRTTEVVVSPK